MFHPLMALTKPLHREYPPETILVIDDDEGLRLLMVGALESAGYSAVSVGSGQAALTWLEEHRTPLLLLDLKMEDLPGLELVRRLRASRASVPFVVVTGHGVERVAVEMM